MPMASAQLEGNITLTNAALLAFHNFSVTEDTDYFRVQVLPGGCSGFKYDIAPIQESDTTEDDIFLTQENINLVVDPYSIQYLDGTLIHYVKSPMQSGFTFQNPNATGGCGCGSSFNA